MAHKVQPELRVTQAPQAQRGQPEALDPRALPVRLATKVSLDRLGPPVQSAPLDRLVRPVQREPKV